MAQGSIAATRSRTPRSVRALVAAALAAVVVLLASGCIGGSPSTAAYVGDDRITQTQLDVALDGVQQTLEQGQQVSAAAVLNVMIAGQIAEQIAERSDITVTDAQRDELLAGSNLAPLLEVPAARQIAYDAADQQIVSQAVGTEAYLKDLQATYVDLNPRFGVLDPASKTIVEGQSSSLSLPPASS